MSRANQWSSISVAREGFKDLFLVRLYELKAKTMHVYSIINVNVMQVVYETNILAAAHIRSCLSTSDNMKTLSFPAECSLPFPPNLRSAFTSVPSTQLLE